MPPFIVLIYLCLYRGVCFIQETVRRTPVCGAAGRCPCPGTEVALGVRGTAAGVTGRGGWG